jgi:Papain family cysteine protease
MIERRYTAVRDVPDAADRIAAPAPTLLPRADLSAWLPPVRDQGQEGCCTMFAGSGILAWHYKRFLGKDLVFSPQFGYRAERILEGDVDQDGGAQSRTMMQVLTKYGLCLEASDPYVDTGWKTPTTLKQLAEARNYRLGAYHRVPDLMTLRSVLASGYVASLAIDVYESFESADVAANGAVPLPAANEQCLGGHEIYCYGYDDKLGLLMCRNSWGADWGQDGDFSLPYGYWPYVSDSWTCHFGKPWVSGLANPANQAQAPAKAPTQSFSFGRQDEILSRLDTIERNTNLILEQNKAMATSQAQLDTQLTSVETVVSKIGTDLTQALADLKAAVPSVDLTPEFNRLVTIASTLTADDAAVTAADPGPASTPTPAPSSSTT